MRSQHIRRYLTLAGFMVCLVGAATVLQPAMAAEEAEGSQAIVATADWDGIAFTSQVAFDSATLVVAGSEGVVSEQTFGPGDTPFVSALGLADGTYTYQLTLQQASAMQSELVDQTGPAENTVATVSGVLVVESGQLLIETAGDGDPGPITNDQVIADDLIVQGDACIGGSVGCADGESFATNVGNADIKVESFDPQILFDDSTAGGDDFAIEVDTDVFKIYNEDLNTLIVGIEAGARANQLYLDSGGGIGVHTTVPAANAELHIEGLGASDPVIRIEDSKFPTAKWNMELETGDLRFNDIGGAGGPILVLEDIEHEVGIGGETNPTATLEVSRSDGTSQVLVDENSATVATRTLLQLENNGRAQMRLSNTSAVSGVNWDVGMGTGDSFIIRRGANEYRFTKGGRVLRFVGGVQKYLFNNNGNLIIAGTLTENSDVNAKRHIVPVDGGAVLAQVAALPVSTWSYKDDEAETRHVGPMAQDFHAAFGLGEDDTHISPRDVAGVALAAVKELQSIVRQKDEQLEALSERLAALEQRLAGQD